MTMIAGIVRFDGGAVDRAELERMKSVLAVHGPDRQVMAVSGEAGFIHCLFRTAPQHGVEQQPLRLPQQGVLVANARLDNRDELSAALGRQPDPTVPDSQLIAWARSKWGDEFAAHLVGDFSCALYERQERRLVIATDHIGHRPLYYHWDGRCFRFASAIKGLHACPGVPRSLNDDALLDWLLRNDVAPGATLYQGISQVPPAHVLVLTERGLSLHRYWDPRQTARTRFARPEDYGEAFRELFGRVVRSHAATSQPLGIMLSGGLDSQAIAATAAPMLQAQGKSLYSFTLVPAPGAELPPLPREGYADERPKVEELCRLHPNLVPRFVSACQDEDLAFMDAEFDARDGPVRETPTYLQGNRSIFAAARERGIRVMLDGSRGNHTISYHGNGRFTELLSGLRYLSFLKEAFALARFYGVSPARFTYRQLRAYAYRWRWTEDARRRSQALDWRHFSFLAPAALERAGGFERLRERRNSKLFYFALGEQERRISRVCERNPGFGTGLLAGGFEFRSPAADRRIIEFCLGLPHEIQLRDGLDRRLMRVEMADRLPASIRLERRRGVQNVDWIDRAERLQPAFLAGLDGMAAQAQAGSLVDLERLERATRAFDPQALRRNTAHWMSTLQGGHNTAGFLRFLKWFDGSNH
jgi:asparagine synthase (glutamine-hydrolysing)